jgi:hypothetical protein
MQLGSACDAIAEMGDTPGAGVISGSPSSTVAAMPSGNGTPNDYQRDGIDHDPVGRARHKAALCRRRSATETTLSSRYAVNRFQDIERFATTQLMTTRTEHCTETHRAVSTQRATLGLESRKLPRDPAVAVAI